MDEYGSHLVVIELKSTRAMTGLLRQTGNYVAIIDQHQDALSQLAEAILGRLVVLSGATEEWIVWPAVGARPDPREAEFREQGVTAFGYSWTDGVLVLSAGRQQAANNRRVEPGHVS